MNVLLNEKFNTPYETIPFTKIKVEDFLPAIEEAISFAKSKHDKLKQEKDISFDDLVSALDKAGEKIGLLSTLFFNLHSAESNDTLRDAAKPITEILTKYRNDFSLDAQMFQAVKSVYDKKETLNLDVDQTRLLDDYYKGFVRNGALLNDSDKEKLRGIDQELSKIGLLYSDHVLADSNKFTMELSTEEDFEGLTEDYKTSCLEMGKVKGKEGKYLVTLDFPSFIPFMEQSENAVLREKLYKAFSSRASNGDENDNREICKKIASLRQERANLLGYADHAAFVLEERMAKDEPTVRDFLSELTEKALPKAKEDVSELKSFKKQITGSDELNRWDFAYYSKKLKKEKFGFDAEELRPYFSLDKVIQGAFDISTKLYGIKFSKRDDIETYHEDVNVYQVDTNSGEFVGVFYTDFFPREGKRSGAWMTSYKTQKREGNENIRPHISIVCNFSKPTGEKPSLLYLNEVRTLFHEFGHALHGLLSNVRYPSQASPDVAWDFVELPSQIMENWCLEKECLDMFAKHYETGEEIPADLLEKIKKLETFMEGYASVRQLSFGTLDLAWHTKEFANCSDVYDFEQKNIAKLDLFETKDESIKSCSFSHIFAGGYSAGYYSYKWAEVLDADAFAYFKEKGIFNPEVATKFKTYVLEKGDTEDPMELYIKFRGRKPSVDALLKRSGLI